MASNPDFDASDQEIARYAKGIVVGRHIERWVFTDDEVKRPKHCRAYDEFVARPQDADEFPDESTDTPGVLVQRNGTVTNRWEDGIAGVPERVMARADAEETLASTDGQIADNWYDVYVDSAGRFAGFVPPSEQRDVQQENLMEAKLPDVLIDLHDLYTAVKVRPVGPEITFHFVAENTTYSQTHKEVVDFLNRHQIAANEIMIQPGAEQKRKWNRAVTLRIAKSALIPSGKFL
jgi:hypothetical protein